MPLNDGEKLNGIEEMKSKLSSRNYRTKLEHRDSFTHFQGKEIEDSWGKEETKPNSTERFFMKTSRFKKFFVFSLFFFILALGYAFYMFFAGGNTVSKDNIDISVLGNNFTAGGEELSLVVGITNKNNSPLELVDLVVEYPKSSSSDTSEGTERLRESLGSIPAGSVRNENIKVTLFGEQSSTIQIKISIEYRVESSNAIFVKDKLYDVNINSTPINLSVDAPTEVSPNQNITFNVKTSLNATKSLPQILLKLDYPVGFQFVSGKPTPSFGNNVWNLGDLSPGAEKSISIVGKMLDVSDGEEKTFQISSGSQSKSDKSAIGITLNSLGYTVTVKKSSVEANLFINGVYGREYASYSKVPIQGEIRWLNNLDTKLNDLEISAKISGNAVDRKTIFVPQGFYNSSKDLIVWDKNSQSKFAEVNPGDSGTVTFSITPLSLFSALGEILSEPSISIEVNIAGKQSLEGYALKELNSGYSAVIRVISDIGLATKALYSSGPFTNTGPVPPKVGKETTFTVIWTLSNTTNNISKSVVTSSLPPWMRFVGSVSPATQDFTYDSSTKEIIWKIGTIPKGTGISQAGREVAFQIAFTPSLSQVGTSPIIMNDAVLTGYDDFAKVDVRVNKTSLNIRLTNDSAFPANGDRVVE